MIATPFVQGRLRGEYLSANVTTECVHSGRKMVMEFDSELNFEIVEGGAIPMVFSPLVDFATLGDPSIIDAF